MKPGRELDKLVAEKLLGLSCTCAKASCEVHTPYFYSTTMGDAWRLVEALMAEPLPGHLGICLLDSLSCVRDGTWVAIFASEFEQGNPCEGESAPHALCLAALDLIGVKV